MSIFNFPTYRKSYASVGNPAFVSDIVAANQLAVDGLTALTGLANPGFAIISGLNYVPGAPGSYMPGVFWLNGFFYMMPGMFSEGLYLKPSLVDLNPEQFSDLSVKQTYTQYVAETSSDGAGATPVFGGAMDFFRIGNQQLKNIILIIQGTVAQLKGAAFADIGTTAGTVAAGNDARFGYSTAYQDDNFARKVAVLMKDSVENANNGNFAPAQPYDPATKKYVDDNSAKRIISSAVPVNVGDIPTGGITVTAALGTTLGSANYLPLVIMYADGTPHDDSTAWWFVIKSSITTTQFQVRFQEGVGLVQNISFDWIIFGR